MTLDEFNTLEDLTQYVGYYWFSDAEKPKVTNFNKLKDGIIPFVIEGFLYHETKKHSIAIKHYNGVYVITSFNLDDYTTKKSAFNLEEVIAHPSYKLDGIKKIKFRTLQQKETDELGFSFYKNVAKLFIGFEK